MLLHTADCQPQTGNRILIGIDASRASAAQRTGTENYSLFLIRALLELDGTNQYLLYFNQPPQPQLFPAQPNATLHALPFPRLWTHVRLSWEMAAHAPDVLFVPAHVLPLVHPRCSVVTVHDLGYLYYPQAHTRGARWYLNWSTRYNARAATHLIADSQATRRDLLTHCGVAQDKVSVVYPGYDPQFMPVRDDTRLCEVRARYGLPASYMLYVGTLQPRKNLARLVAAFAALVAQGTPADLALAGKKGWLYDALFAQVRQLGLETRVHFVGYVPQEELPALLSGAQVFVLPSLYEGFGLPVLEAMACGTPVICSNTSSLPEVAGDAALLVNPDDTDQLASAMRRILADGGLRRDLAQKGLAQVKHFSWTRCAQETLAILEACALPRPTVGSLGEG
jgi:glycosyltransferase involved in cell wall biosynthesis